MAGKIKEMIDKIIETRSNGDNTVANTTKAKLVLKGIDPSDFDSDSSDDSEVLEKLEEIAESWDIEV